MKYGVVFADSPVAGAAGASNISMGGVLEEFPFIVEEGLMIDISEGVGDNDISMEAPG